ncbi:uncharacterized protein [Nicotiana sylvestris]|uniref:uncharacterized protein n=1 Tax=Nicotiana sylvestris TaxID=4096 RepID=UPI00388CA734
MNQEPEYDKEEAFREINRELEQFENRPKPNLNDTKPVNLETSEEIRETKISIYTDEKTRDALIQLLFEFKDVFAWSYDDMPGLSVDLQKQRKFKTDISDKIKEEVIKQLKAGVIRLVRYTTWLANVVLVPKKDGKIRVYVDYRDLNKASPKDNLPLPNIHILVDNCAKHEIKSFVDCYAGYHQVLMDEEVAEKIAFTIPWGTYCYRVMPFGLKNTGVTYMRAMTAIFHDMMHQEIEVYVDDALADHLAENPVDDEYQPLTTYFPDEEVNSVKPISKDTHAWKMFFDGAVNAKGVGIGAILISPTGQHYPATAQLQFFYTNNTAEYEACIIGMKMAIDQDVEELLIMRDSDLIIRQAQGEWETRDVKLIPYRQHVEDLGKRFKSIEFRYIPHCHNELVDALATLASFKITHRNSTPYRPKANGAVEAANKNIKMILRKMIQSSKQWHEKLPFALLGYCTTMCTSVGATPYLLVYDTEAVIATEVEIPSLRIIMKAEIEDSEWVKSQPGAVNPD